METNELVQLILDKTAWNKGCTIDVHGNEPMNGYAVSLKDHGAICGQIDNQKVKAFIGKNKVLLMKAGHYIGTWIDECTSHQGSDTLDEQSHCEERVVYLDVTQIVTSKAEAIAIGHLNDQKAIYCIHTGKTISVPLAWELMRIAVTASMAWELMGDAISINEE